MTTTLSADVGTFSLSGFNATLGNVGIRQRIIDALDTQLKSILIASGYDTNVGSNVFSWRDIENNPFAASELPGLNYRDSISDRSVGCGSYDNTLRVDVEAYAASMEDIRQILGDIEKVIVDNEQWGGIADGSDLLTDESNVVHLENKYFRTMAVLEIYFGNIRGDVTRQ